jgi:hypothetical protein
MTSAREPWEYFSRFLTAARARRARAAFSRAAARSCGVSSGRATGHSSIVLWDDIKHRTYRRVRPVATTGEESSRLPEPAQPPAGSQGGPPRQHRRSRRQSLGQGRSGVLCPGGRAATLGPALRTSRLDAARTCGSAVPKTRRRLSAVPPCAPTPGARKGPPIPARSRPNRSTASPTVAPTTSPTEPSSPRAAASALSAVAPATTCPATLCPCRTVRAGRGAFRVGGEREDEDTAPGRVGEVDRRAQRAIAEVGAQGDGVGRLGRVLAEERLGIGIHRRPDVPPLDVEDHQGAGSPQSPDESLEHGHPGRAEDLEERRLRLDRGHPPGEGLGAGHREPLQPGEV